MQYLWYTESAYKLADELLCYGFCGLVWDGICFHPLAEIVSKHEDVAEGLQYPWPLVPLVHLLPLAARELFSCLLGVFLWAHTLHFRTTARISASTFFQPSIISSEPCFSSFSSPGDHWTSHMQLLYHLFAQAFWKDSMPLDLITLVRLPPSTENIMPQLELVPHPPVGFLHTGFR